MPRGAAPGTLRGVRHPPLECPSCCGGLVAPRGDGLACEACSAAFPQRGDVLGAPGPEPAGAAPLAAGDLDAPLAALARGEPYREVVERLLCAVREDAAERLLQLLREGRAAFLPLLRLRGGSALVVGNALSGTAVGLARAGFAVTLADASPERLAFAAHRARALCPPGSTRALCVARGDGLPFRSGTGGPSGRTGAASASGGPFDLVVREEPFCEEDRAHLAPLDLCRRLARGELVVTADNRLGYKVSSGVRGDFRVLSPLAFARNALRGGGRRTLAGWRRALAPAAGERLTAHALYPHSRDFAHVAAIDEPTPRLYVGPKERRNAAKIAAYRAGLFSVLTPSFALVLARPGLPEERRLDGVLEELAGRLGERVPEVEALVSTRGNNALAMTARAGADEREPEGRWILRIPLSPAQELLVDREHEALRFLRRELPAVPVPEALFLGEVEGLHLSCERRLPGHSAAQHSGERAAMQRLFDDASEQLAGLFRRRATFDEAMFERAIARRCELACAHAEPASTRAALEGMRDLARAELVGRELPLVLRHCDLRGKHVQIEPDGRVVGYYAWGTMEDHDLPYLDLLHLVVHERMHEAGLTAGAAWAMARDLGAGLRPEERAALDRHAERVGLDRETRGVLERIYPLLVAAMAEKNWDLSRPRWLLRGFGL